MDLREVREGDADAWQALLERQHSGDFLHDWQWAAVAAYDGQPQRRFVLEQEGQVHALVAAQERRLGFGRSFWYVPHGPVMDFEDAAASDRLSAVLAGLRDVARQRQAIAVRLEPRVAMGSTGSGLMDRAGLRAVPGHLQVGHTRIVALGSDDDMLAAMDKDTRYSVRRAEREEVTIQTTSDPSDVEAIDALYDLAALTQQRAGFPLRPRERFRLAWRQLAGAGRAWIMQARHRDELLASAMLIREGVQSFYFLAGSTRELPGQTKRFASHALQWSLMRHARDGGAQRHDLWGISPPDAGPDHPWAGVGHFKKGFGGEAVAWAGMWDLVVDPLFYRAREAAQPVMSLVRKVRSR